MSSLLTRKEISMEGKRSILRENHMRELEDRDVWVGATRASQDMGVSRQSIHNFYRRGIIRGINTDAGLLLDKTHAGYRELVRKARKTAEDA